MNKVDVMANTAWAIGDDYELNLVERKLDKFSSEQLKQFDSRMDKLNLKEASKLKILTFFFGAFGIARFMTGQKNISFGCYAYCSKDYDSKCGHSF
ncbi:hypothetical protein [Campylobacter sp.]|uniref:hypothetical protein n=1 Tax=Campylobacter sp. TaxID=205 RepID=UPI0026DC8177|nr:hypothetical protein [Campylobacter sp.]MDO4674053.1 hypothetical protein [Campylobacter sp.]